MASDIQTKRQEMSNPQLSPLEINPLTGEPFLRLRKHRNIIITPPRENDKACYIPYMNDPKIYNGLLTTPRPYTQEHADNWYERIKRASDGILKELDDARDQSDLVLASGCPVRAIREIMEDGTDVFIGDIGIGRVFDPRLLVLPKRDDATEEEKKAALAANNDLPLGDPRILYTVGDWVAPSHHGKGIVTDALETLLWDWGVPRMGVHKIRACVFQGNQASVRVMEKNGFKVTQTLNCFMEVRGQMRDLHVMEWAKDGPEV